MTLFGLRARIISGYVVLASITLAASVLLVRHMVKGSLVRELETRGEQGATGLASMIVHPLLVDDRVAVLKLAARMGELDDQTEYVLVVDAFREAVAHTLPGRPSKELIAINWPRDANGCTRKLLDTEQGVIYDFAAPIHGGQLGVVRLGLSTR